MSLWAGFERFKTLAILSSLLSASYCGLRCEPLALTSDSSCHSCFCHTSHHDTDGPYAPNKTFLLEVFYQVVKNDTT